MIRRLWAILKAPYPAGDSPADTVFYGIGCGLFVSLFFTLFEPFGFFMLPHGPRWALYAGYGLVTAAAILLNGLLLPRLRPRFFREENWSLGRQIACMAWVTLAIGIGCYLLSRAVCAFFAIPAGWVRLRVIVVDTFLIAIIPITVINLINYGRLLRRNLNVVREANQRLELPPAPSPAPGAQGPLQVEIVAENGRDALRMDLADLLYIQAEENYVRLQGRGGGPAQPLLRSSLSRVERQLRPLYPRLFRCHRAFIVHLPQIARVGGNAQGLKLTLKDSPAVIPVARRYVDEFRRVIQGL